MSIHLYYADPYGSLKFDDYLHYTKAVAEWIVFVEDRWPHTDIDDPYYEGIAIDVVTERAGYNLAKWGKNHLQMPALVFLDKPISSFQSTVPPTGFTRSEAPRISFVTTTFGGNIPKDVVGLTVLHELLHMAHYLANSEGPGLKDGHCESDRCVLNAKRDGDFEGDVQRSFAFLRDRSCSPCEKCGEVLEKVNQAGYWS